MSTMNPPSDGWDPGQYHRFAAERRQPFVDLLAMVEAKAPGRVVDLGCGSGELTRELHEAIGARTTVGVDHSPAMLAEAASHAGGGLTFLAGDIAVPPVEGPFDVVFANAALQWVPDHPTVLARWAALLGEHGELAVQVPANVDHPAHRLIEQIASEAPFVDAEPTPPPPDAVHGVLKPEHYAELLFDLGFTRQHVRLQVYGHVLESAEAVVEWTKGTSLTRMKRHFSPEVYEAFVAEYRHRVVAELGGAEPYFYAFKRILMHAGR